MTTILIMVLLLGLLLAGIPVAFALAGLGAAMLLVGGFSLTIAAHNLMGGLDNFVLLMIPLFLLMANILLKGGVGRDLFAGFQAWVGHWPGGLAIATLFSCGIFAAINGSSVATAATVGTVAIPEMTKRGYKRSFAYGLVAAGGTLGILIPPSIPLIVYGVITEESILSLFLAGIGPGLVLLTIFGIYSIFYCSFSGSYVPLDRLSRAERKTATIRSLPTVILAVIIIAGIYFGIFTPTEAAAIGFISALILTSFILRTMTWKKLREAVDASLKTTVMILLIIVGAKIFGGAITLYRIPQEVTAFVTGSVHSPFQFLLAVTLVLLIVGLFLESLSMMLIMVPILYPSLNAFNIDPIWFGIYFVILTEIALITPPVGMNLFVLQAVSKGKITEIIRGVIPFILILLGTALLVYLVPSLVTYIPFNIG